MTLRQKILSCYGNLTPKSTAIVCNCTVNHVYYYLKKYNKKIVKKNAHRLPPKWHKQNITD